VTLQLDSPSYTTTEGNPAAVCVSVTGDVVIDSGLVDFTLQLTPLTAGGKNYM
jgi:hypothetical protein